MANTKSGSKGTQGGTPEQHAEAGRQSHKNDANRNDNSQGSRQSGNQGSQGSGNQGSQGSGNQGSQGSGSGMRGGTPEQHAEAGRQSHKNDKK